MTDAPVKTTLALRDVPNLAVSAVALIPALVSSGGFANASGALLVLWPYWSSGAFTDKTKIITSLTKLAVDPTALHDVLSALTTLIVVTAPLLADPNHQAHVVTVLEALGLPAPQGAHA